MDILFDGYIITNKETLFKSLKEQIKSDEFYGDNLDALWDVLTTIRKEIRVTITNNDRLKENLGNYYDSLLLVFNDLNDEGIHTQIIINN